MEIEIQTPRTPGLSPTPPQRHARDELIATIREVIQLEATALNDLVPQINESFYQALKTLEKADGKVILTGVGKSGLIAKKIAATMTSTGTMATFLHPADGMHGDLGVVSHQDVVIAIGKSGESEELVGLVNPLRRIGAKIIAITARPDSRLAKASDVALITPVKKEACPLNLAPTVSTTLALAVGDALAVALMKMKNFKPDDFAKYHPGGKLGKRLLLQVRDLMIPINKCAVLDPSRSNLEDVVLALSEAGHGIVLFAQQQNLRGIITDGDIRRILNLHRARFFDVELNSAINHEPLTISGDIKAVEALKFMEERERPLNVVPVTDQGRALGIIRLHDLFTVS